MKLKAGAITYAIFIAFLVFGLCSSFIMYGHFHRKLINNNEGHLKNLIDLRSAIELCLSNDDPLFYGEEREIQLFPEENSRSIRISKYSWGLYDLMIAQLQKKSMHKTKSALVGASDFDYSQHALYLADRNNPLSLAGNTKILGQCVLPKSGLKKAYIEGQNFNGTMPSIAKEQHSEKNIPSPNKERIGRLKELLNFDLADSLVDIDLLNNSLIYNPWHHNTAGFKSNSALILQSISINGRFIIRSTESIAIEKCNLNGVILIAPKVRVRNQIRGNFQIIATDSIILEKGSTLYYPSSLTIIDKNEDKSFQPTIIIRDNSKVEGDVLMHSDYSRHKNQLLLSVDETSSITGRAYVNGLADLKGDVNGALFCEGFILKTPSSIYSNHLLNATIDRNSLPTNYLSSALFTTSDKNIIKWLN